ncbi:dTMP kinase [Microaerobacter geothermalis]|nr:dTMP kinase [Microaerobacter geothermalis]MCF6095141.1 dTMP kinase [Microaerobacter geothermalis]
MNHPGIFITFEGPDGAGKTTQIERIGKKLEEKGFKVVTTREPGGTMISNEIRRILLSPSFQEMVKETEVLLYAASRAQHVMEFIIPHIEKGYIVLCDRFVDASIAYQGYGLQIPLETIQLINQFATNRFKPHRTYLIDVPIEIGKHRLLQRSGDHNLDRIEQKNHEYHQRVRDGFYALAKKEKERIKLVNGTLSQDKVYQLIYDDLISYINKRLGGLE